MNDEQIKAELERHLGGEWEQTSGVWKSGMQTLTASSSGLVWESGSWSTPPFDSLANLAAHLREIRDTLATIPNKPLSPPVPEPVVTPQCTPRRAWHRISVERRSFVWVADSSTGQAIAFTPNEWDRVTKAAAPMVAWVREHGEG